MAVSISGQGTRQAGNSASVHRGQQVAVEEEDKPKGKKKLIIIIVAIILVLAIGYLGVTKVILKPVPHYGPNDPPKNTTTYSLPSETLNLADGSLLQVTLALQLTEVANVKSIGTFDPQMENALIQDCGTWTYHRLLAANGKMLLAQQLLHSFQGILKPVDGGEQVSEVYFTAFTLQDA